MVARRFHVPFWDGETGRWWCDDCGEWLYHNTDAFALHHYLIGRPM